jgi:hypothetical protein
VRLFMASHKWGARLPVVTFAVAGLVGALSVVTVPSQDAAVAAVPPVSVPAGARQVLLPSRARSFPFVDGVRAWSEYLR